MRRVPAFISNYYQSFDRFNIIYFLYAHGLAVDRDYRDKGIACELLKARGPLMKTLNVFETHSIFTTVGAQKAALKAGYKEVFSIPYKLLNEQFPKLDLAFTNCDDCKILSLKI
jgi:hypothetical protein